MERARVDVGQNDMSRVADALPLDGGVDSLGAPTDVPQQRHSSTVETTMALLAVPWALSTTCLVTVIAYINVHNFAVHGALVSAAQRGGVVGAISPAHRDAARYTLLAVSVVVFLLHIGLSYLLFRQAYRVLLDVSASLLDLSLIMDMCRRLRCGIFFFVDSVQRARHVEGCGRFWVMEFSPYREISDAEAALNAMSLRMSSQETGASRETAGQPLLQHDGDVRVSASTSASGSFHRSFSQSLSSPSPQHPLAESLLSLTGRPRVPSPGLELSAGQLGVSARSFSTASELAATVRPFQLTLRRRHVALLHICFLTYRQLVQGDAETVVHITRKFLSAVLLCTRHFNAHVVELFNDSAILSWNGFVESAGDYVQTCAQCGYWFHEHFLKGLKGEESGAFFTLCGYAGYVVCGTTSEDACVLHGCPVTVLRALPSLLERRYCTYVWLGAPPRLVAQGGGVGVRWGTIVAAHGVSFGLHVMGDQPDDAEWGTASWQPRVWHVPEWRTFGEEGTMAVTTEVAEEKQAATTTTTDVMALRSSSSGANPVALSRGVASQLETFQDRNHILYQLSNTVLGESKACVVRLAVSNNGTLVAVKEIKIERGNFSAMRQRRYQREKRIVIAQGDRLEWMNEVRIMEKLHHTCIVGYISFQETHDRLRIVMEYVGGGNLLQFVSQNATDADVGRPPMEILLRSVLEGIDFLHRHSIIHRDIKPQNVLVPDSGPCKIADFGISQRLSHTSTHPVEGTPFYMAPEATRNEASTASDIWSFGIMMAEVLTGRLPYDSTISDTYLITQFMFGHDVERHLAAPLTPAAYDVFLACTQYEPGRRKTASELLQMPYFNTKA